MALILVETFTKYLPSSDLKGLYWPHSHLNGGFLIWQF